MNQNTSNRFKASCRWFNGSKKRNNITFKTSVGEARLADSKIIKNYLNVVLPDLIKDYETRNILNADETGLFLKQCQIKCITRI
jgi:hypothetical protein